MPNLPPEPTAEQVLDLPLPKNDSGADTIRGYLIALLRLLWSDGAGFNSKRPFGNSSWKYDMHARLVKAGWVAGSFDEDGYLEYVDAKAAAALMDKAIRTLGGSDAA